MCDGYRFSLRAVWASTVGSRFEKILRRFVASEVRGSDRQTDRKTDRQMYTDSFGLSVIEDPR